MKKLLTTLIAFKISSEKLKCIKHNLKLKQMYKLKSVHSVQYSLSKSYVVILSVNKVAHDVFMNLPPPPTFYWFEKQSCITRFFSLDSLS